MKLILFILINNYLLDNCEKYCLKCDSSGEQNLCLYCDLSSDSVLESSACVKLQFEGCTDYWSTGSCIQCESGYYLEEAQCTERTSTEIENCSAYDEYGCVLCKDGFRLDSEECVEVTNLIKGCVKYTDDVEDSCEMCDSGDYLNRAGTACISFTESEKCKYYSYIQCNACADGYFYNNNYYLDYYLQFTSKELRSVFSTFEFINSLLMIPVCEAVTVTNCVELKSASKCIECEEGYYLSNYECVEYPIEKILNCSVYTDGTTCSECSSGFYLENSSTCTAVGKIANCKSYSGKASITSCKECESIYFLSSETCQTRQKIISNCLTYVADQEQCSVCDSGYQLTDDLLACLEAKDNCLTYQISSESTEALTCSTCANGMTYNTISTECEQGTISNCEIYTDNDVCQQCADEFFLNNNGCSPQSTIENCAEYSTNTINICSTCQAEYIVFVQLTQCTSVTQIPHCITYEGVNECSECEDGYYLVASSGTTVNSCQAIDEDLHCLQYSNSICTLCEEGTTLESNGKCSITIDYYLELCGKSNLDGTVSNSNFSCEYCDQGSIPINLDGAFVCTSSDNFSSVPRNCSKWELEESTLEYNCSFCEEGYYLYSNNCYSGGCPNSSSDLVIVVQSIEKQQSSNSSNYNSYITGQVNYCAEIDELSTDNCLKAAVNIFYQSTSATDVNYTCIECQDSYLPIIIDKEVTNFKTGDLDSDLEGPLIAYPGLNCLALSVDTVQSSDKTNNMVQNCELYYNIARQSSSDYYGCLRCAFGYGGEIQAKVDDVTDYLYYGYIDKCELINENLEDNEGQCDLDVKYQGYTNSHYEVDWNLVPLETYLSCFKCSNDSYRPFLFIAFEDVEFLSSNEDYDDIIDGTDSRLRFYTETKYNPYANEMEKPPVLLRYNLVQGTTTSKDPYTQKGGKSLMCLENQPSTFFLNSTQYKLLGADENSWNKCALGIVNVNRKTNATTSNSSTPSLATTTVYCGACMPGYAASYSPKIKDDSSSSIFIPYYIYACTAITNCSDGGTWVNNCEVCDDGYAWIWNTTLKTIQYDQCSQLNTATWQCAAVNPQTGSCVYCKKGYSMINGRCDKIIPAFCDEEETIFESAFEANYNYVAMGRNRLYLKRYPNGCNFCQNGLLSAQVSLSDSLTNLSLLYTCAKSFYLQEETITSQNTYFIQHCINYFINKSDTSKLTCIVCDSGYILTNSGTCISGDTIANCSSATLTDGTYICSKCKTGYIFLNEKCTKGTIDKCLTYNQTYTSTTQTCTECMDGYYTTGTACVKGTLNNCVSYSSQSSCSKCSSGYVVLNISGGTLCISISSSFNCSKFDQNNLQLQQLSCSVCNTGYYPKSISSSKVSKCINFQGISNCTSYSQSSTLSASTFQCTGCSDEYYLSNNSCILRTTFDSNCLEYNSDSEQCIECATGYYLSSNKKSCKANPNGIIGCRIYKSASECSYCKTNYYLSNNSCVFLSSGSRIANCVYYSSSTDCSQCTSAYYVSNGLCKSTSALNCEIASSSTACSSCPDGYGMRVQNYVTSCVLIEQPNCITMEEIYPFSCSLCENGYYLNSGSCTALKTNEIISNCIAYDTKTTCQICDEGYFLSIDFKTCSTNSTLEGLRDDNCAQLQIISPQVCLVCKEGYYFSEGVCTACSNLSSGCMYCDYDAPETCLLCKSGYYMNASSTCVQRTTSTGGEVVDSFSMILRVVLLVIMNI